jgi:tetratricopeptide (TPR) repeat protein
LDRAGERLPRDPIAWDLFLRGRYQADRRTEPALIRSIADFQAAIARDSGFADAWAGLARALWYSKNFRYRISGVPRDSLVPRLVVASDRAIEADSTSAYAWVARGLALREIDPGSRRNQLLALQRAIGLDSTLADAWFFAAVAWDDSLVPAKALECFRRAIRLEPGHRQAIGQLAVHYLWARQYDSAVVWADSGKSVDPTLLIVRQASALSRLMRGELARAEEDFLAALRLAQGSDEVHGWAGLADLAWRRNDHRAADTLLAHAIAAADTTRPSLHDAAFLAWGYAATGHHVRAIRLLERYQPRNDMHFQVHLQRDPTLDSLRADPSFIALLARPDAQLKR